MRIRIDTGLGKLGTVRFLPLALTWSLLRAMQNQRRKRKEGMEGVVKSLDQRVVPTMVSCNSAPSSDITFQEIVKLTPAPRTRNSTGEEFSSRIQLKFVTRQHLEPAQARVASS
jgi:hypothetical protein